MTLSVAAIPMFTDNYAWLLLDAAAGLAAVVDPADPGPVEMALANTDLRLSLVLLTHHHTDHVGCSAALAARLGAQLVGARADAERLPPTDALVSEGDVIMFTGHRIDVFETPGHTVGHISYYVPDLPALFAGDTLFSLGCGRLFEGTPQQMFQSLHKFDLLPPQTLLCCGHEYTEANARFALSVDPDNTALQHRAREVSALRARGTPTLPIDLATERATNPFLRAPTVDAFAALRRRKDLGR